MSLSDRVERSLIRHCSPTLASLKTASLFTLEFSRHGELNEVLREWNRRLSDKGVAMLALREADHRALIYVFRKKRLREALACPKIKEFLRNGGYRDAGVGAALSTLRAHLSDGEFPHEIGVFLGYPLDDVIGFIRNKGRNCKCTGCWKVYCNECEAAKTFARYKKCETIYKKLWEQGRSVRQLTVAV
ncbi:MAG: DUF3793 family protein [Bacteroides sp.]|nr:DUF3793 family protein [Eubacterium sp.]MCM1419220.1 DUF3793 family protein [Roseburia sp.]MCM1463458.1 DUF3793 family protein [Bacteroides sp.]